MDTNSSHENSHHAAEPLTLNNNGEVISENGLGKDDLQTNENNADNKVVVESEMNNNLFVIEGVSTNSGVNG